MVSFPTKVVPHEMERLRFLKEVEIIGSDSELAFDRIAAHACGELNVIYL